MTVRMALTVLLLAAGSGAAAAPADGRDGMGYSVRRSECGPVILHFPERNRKITGEVEELLCEALPGMLEHVGLDSLASLDVYVVRGREDMLTLSGGRLPEWGEAFSDMRRGMIVIDAASVTRTPRPLRTVVRHELSHVILARKVEGAPLPTWFVEGLAMIQSREWNLLDQWSLMTAFWSNDLPALEDLGGGFPPEAERASAAYRLSYSAVDRLLSEDPGSLVTLLSFTRETGDFARAFEMTFGTTQEDFMMQFHLSLEKRYGAALPLLRSPPFWVGLTLLFLLAYVLKRLRSRRKEKSWDEA